MESMQINDELTDHVSVTCPHIDCSLPVTRHELEEHLLMCHTSLAPSQPAVMACARSQELSGDCSQECPNGCGLPVQSNESKEHNCISELRTSIEELRTEMLCRMEDQKKEMEAMFDMQRGHMLKKESVLKEQIQILKSELGQLGDRLRMLLDVEMSRKKELERLASERAEIMLLLANLQSDKQDASTTCQNCAPVSKGKVTNV